MANQWGVVPSDVLNATGQTVTTAQISQADAVVSLYVNRDAAASGSMGARDLNSIKQAIIWQTPWQAAQPGYYARNQFDQLSQDGVAVSSSAEWAKVLAPLAARALKNLSWKGSRTVRTPRIETPAGFGAQDFLLESGDWHESFQPWEGHGART